MFNAQLLGKVRSIGASVREVKKQVHRISDVALLFDFSGDFAAGVQGGQGVLESMTSGPVKASTIEVNEGVAVRLNAGEADEIEVLGEVTTVVCSRPLKEGAGPMARVNITFATADEPHLWFVHHLEEEVAVDIQRRQMELDLGGGDE
jgi:hypothetical protein